MAASLADLDNPQCFQCFPAYRRRDPHTPETPSKTFFNFFQFPACNGNGDGVYYVPKAPRGAIDKDKETERTKTMKANITNTNNGTPTGKTFTRVVFFMAQNPDNDRWEPLAYFPDLPWDIDKKNMTSYMHNGQHGPCCESFLFEDCKAPSNKFDYAAVRRLKDELEHLPDPYALAVIDTKEWLASHKERAAEIRDTIFQLCYKKDSELMLAANAMRKRA